jgi:hypothetical protein
MPASQPVTYFQPIPIDDINKQKVLEILDLIFAAHKDVDDAIQIANIYSDSLGEDIVEKIISYISMVMELYTKSEPKINKRIEHDFPIKSKYETLKRIDDYRESMAKIGTLPPERLLKSYKQFAKAEKLLRDLYEELGYTGISTPPSR